MADTTIRCFTTKHYIMFSAFVCVYTDDLPSIVYDSYSLNKPVGLVSSHNVMNTVIWYLWQYYATRRQGCEGVIAYLGWIRYRGTPWTFIDSMYDIVDYRKWKLSLWSESDSINSANKWHCNCWLYANPWDSIDRCHGTWVLYYRYIDIAIILL